MLLNPYSFASAVATDPYFANVVLLCHFDGADQSTSFIDSSSQTHTLFGNGAAGVKLVALDAKFGSACLSLPGGVGSGVRSNDSADWDFGAGQFTVELFIRPTSAFTGVHRFVAHYPISAPNLAWAITFNNATGNFQFQYSTTGTNSINTVAAFSPPLNTWTHIAVDRDASNVLRIYADGVVIASVAAAATIFNSTLQLAIGQDSSNSSAFVGRIDELRITKGVARYAGAFTPPTAAFPNS